MENPITVYLSFIVLFLIMGYFLKLKNIFSLCYLMAYSVVVMFAFEGYLKTLPFLDFHLAQGISRLLFFVFGVSVSVYYIFIKI